MAKSEDEAVRRHAAVYATPGLPPFTFRSVGAERRLWHGRNPLTAVDVRQLSELGITHVLDLRERWEWAAPGRFGSESIAEMEALGIVRCHLPIRDTDISEATQFAAAVGFLQEAWANENHRLFVHCRFGKERTGMILGAWRALRDETDVSTALAALNAEGAVLDPLPHQRQAAQHWLQSQATHPVHKD